MADYGIKITREGVSIDSTDPKNFLKHSGYKTLKSEARATTTMTLPNGDTTVTKNIAHGLGYAPLFVVAAEMNTDKWYILHSIQVVTIDAHPTKAYNISATSDATNISIVLSTPLGNPFGSDQTYNITYYTIIDEIQ